MVPGKYPITIFRGGTYNTSITAKTKVSGVSISFDQYTLMRMQIRPPWVFNTNIDIPEPLLELTTENGGLAISSNGLDIIISISASTTKTLPFTEGVYDLELVIQESGKEDIVDKILYGSVTVIGEVTV